MVSVKYLLNYCVFQVREDSSLFKRELILYVLSLKKNKGKGEPMKRCLPRAFTLGATLGLIYITMTKLFKNKLD